MCGIAGIYSPHLGPELGQVIQQMCDSISHRGPDDQGTWFDTLHYLALGQRRLAIVDLSPEGHQPMLSGSGRYVMTFNGEVFNYQELTQELLAKGHRFRGHSDTEVMLAAIDEWGVEAAVQRFVGMFAFALWDTESRVLTLCRDRLGIKPLYFGWTKETFLFGSELKVFTTLPHFSETLSRSAIAQMLTYGYVPGPTSIYENIFKLPPGTFIQFSSEVLTRRPSNFTHIPEQSGKHCPKSYWSIERVANKSTLQPFRGSDSDALNELERLLKDSVSLRMIADVPLGAFLSGGIDSSLVVALMQSLHSQPVKTFTIGFEERSYNEAEHAKAIAQHLGTEHEELYVSEADLLNVVPLIPTYYDEPFADSSQIPMYLVSKLARTKVTVALSGDGGDELFCGYNRYIYPERTWNTLRILPLGMRKLFARLLGFIPMTLWESLAKSTSALLPSVDKPAERLQKLSLILKANGLEELYEQLLCQWIEGADGLALKTPLSFPGKWQNDITEFKQRAMFLDQGMYLPDDNLVKVDRASMAVALEARVPLLDHRVVEFAASLPIHLKYRDGKTKWLLRQLLYKYLPPSLIERPKMGFSVPIGNWLRGPLRSWGEDMLSPDLLNRQGLLNPIPIQKLWAEHQSGAHNWQHQLWCVLMFQSWYSKYHQ